MLLAAAGFGAESVDDVFTSLAAYLSDGNAASFMKRFDPAMSGYAALDANVRALVDNANVGSSVLITGEEGDDRSRTVELDWDMEIAPLTPGNGAERRRQTVTCKLERRGKKWVITALAPVEFFAPHRP